MDPIPNPSPSCLGASHATWETSSSNATPARRRAKSNCCRGTFIKKATPKAFFSLRKGQLSGISKVGVFCSGKHNSKGMNKTTKHAQTSGRWLKFEAAYGGFLKWWYPQNTPKWSFLVGKPMVVGETHHFRKPPYMATQKGVAMSIQWLIHSTPRDARLAGFATGVDGAKPAAAWKMTQISSKPQWVLSAGWPFDFGKLSGVFFWYSQRNM